MSRVSKWLTWTPNRRIFSKNTEEAPTKPSEPLTGISSVGFVGTIPALLQKIEVSPGIAKGLDEGTAQRRRELMPALPVDKQQATAPSAVWMLNMAGCRILPLADGFVVGLWPDLDCPELRAALVPTGFPVVYLDGPEVPAEFKTRYSPVRNAGEPFEAWLKRAELESEKRVAALRSGTL